MYKDFTEKFTFDGEIGGIYSEVGDLGYLLSQKVRVKITSTTNRAVAYSVSTNNFSATTNTAISKQFTDYFIFYDDDAEKNDYVILKIFSDGLPFSCQVGSQMVPNCTTTYVNIEVFNHNSDEVNITFNNIDINKLEVNLTDFAVTENNEEILKLVKELDVLLDVNSFNEDGSFKYNDGFSPDNTTLTYTIDKPLY